VIELVDPRGRRVSAAGRMAERPSLSSLRKVAFLSNEEEFMHGALHFPRYTRILERVLRDRLGIDEFHREVKPVLSRPAEPDQLDRFMGWQAVINGLAK